MFNLVRLARKIPLYIVILLKVTKKQVFFELEINKKKVLLGVIEKTHIEKSVFLFPRAKIRKFSSDSRSNESLHN